ncbi:twin-arginine translocase TatA/TatE family subunit [Thermoflexus sp.]|uniref:Sec-independent protein translocase subunit TatA/TatB n=2 Tax=Thermoflexus sp. TaxID=1969742 RepID=UPI002608ACB1|nr:twin-arginine translocase TatA/TatE family subunit [Thermoflexus sp.]MCS7158731.1 twin-arginine translocase TatA/TatE family subunit [Blastocatellia bacterium]MCX7690421.1 twin-arginine translocase TatA/TatE family subunit [Thermoflexus sp.]
MESLFGIGPMELAFIFLLAFVLLGPRDLPRLAYQLGRWIRQAQLLYAEFRREWEAEVQEASREVEWAVQDQPKVTLPPEAATYQLPSLSGTADANPSTTDRPEDR